jgi:NADH:ubiquinone oxidoreductase subunit 2 (subunit N)
MFYIYGTGELFLIQCLNILSLDHTIAYSNNARMLILVFITSIFFKLGVTPFHLFKVEVYKGIPFLSIFFYTTYYFFLFFLFFIYLLSDFLVFFVNQYILFISIVLFLGSIYIIVLLFDVSFIKVFFTYSTVINTIGFLIIFIADL